MEEVPCCSLRGARWNRLGRLDHGLTEFQGLKEDSFCIFIFYESRDATVNDSSKCPQRLVHLINLKDLTKYFSVNSTLFLIQLEVVSICISNLVDGVPELMHVEFRDFNKDLESGIARR
ncbi:hypothetical protein Tco_1045198 [Tanacetum coccineum]|uniref:Uncharacterized protein n=1 Tax=Tanacetum coccineum TaxID=301880 RepID=A0ABQ5GUK6_9ASTR